ncbi:hypothetical protein GCM10009593_43090 [Microlunatus antarcticus]
MPAPGVPGRAGGRLGVGPAPVLVPPGRGAEVEGRSSWRAAGVGVAGRGAPGRAEAGVALRVVEAPGLPGADGVGGFRVDGAVLGAGAGGVRVEGAVDSADVRAAGAAGAAGVRVEGADGAAGVRVDGEAPGRGPGVADEVPGTLGRGAEGVADGALGLEGAVGALGAAGAALRAAGTAGVGRAAGASAGASFSRRRRMTGASRVDEGDLTNSPMSLAIERTALLSTPSSLASS